MKLVDVSLEDPKKIYGRSGQAVLLKKGFFRQSCITIIWLKTIKETVRTLRKMNCLNLYKNIESLIEELVIHEALHEQTQVKEEWIIDSWHMLLCRLDNNHIKTSSQCKCPIDCFWRDVLANKEVYS